MSSVWIVHREVPARAALARLAGDPRALVGAPHDPRFEAAPPPRVVVLGLAADFEAELEFTHRFAPAAPEALWVLVARPAALAEARRLFDAVCADFLPYPPASAELRARLREAAEHRSADPLARRRKRDALAERFARWFADLELPGLLRALDPDLARVPLRVQGEPGTGRALLAHYVHAFGARPVGPFILWPATAEANREALLERLAAAARPARMDALPATVCVEDAERLPASLQVELAGWIATGPPPERVRGRPLRFMASIGECDGELPETLTPELEAALSGRTLRIPPLRERPAAIVPFARATIEAWCRAHGERPRELHPETLALLREHPWPGNLRELESCLLTALASGSDGPLRPEDLPLGVGPPEGGAPVEEAPLRETAVAPSPAPEPEPAPPPTPPEARERAPEPLEPLEELPLGEEPETSLEVEPLEADDDAAARRLAAALASELQEPADSLRRLAEMLPAHAQDPGFQRILGEQLEEEGQHLASAMRRLARFGTLEPALPARVHLAEILDCLLEDRRAEIQRRRLLVLKELDRDDPEVWADPAHLRLALEVLLDAALARVPERGDLYVSSRRQPAGAPGSLGVRVLIRFENPPIPGRPFTASLDAALAEVLVRALGGRLQVDTSSHRETLVLVELPAPH